MLWTRSNRFDPRALELADRHYSRQKPGTPQFVKAGSCAVFFAETKRGKALWVTVWQQHVRHAWPGAWECALFRNERAAWAPSLIKQAVAATRAHYGTPPANGMITFVDADKVREKADPGHCFLRAGFTMLDETTASGLLVIQMLPAAMPAAEPLAWSDAPFPALAA
jgi:hypothetical protein